MTPAETSAASPVGVPAPTPDVDRPPRRMHRPQDGTVIVGVAAGLAEHLGLSVNAVRWAFVLATVLTGVGLPAYLMLWAFTPVGYRIDPGTGQVLVAGERPWGQRLRTGGTRWALVLVAAAVVMGTIGVPAIGGVPSITVVLAIVAILGGVALAWSRLDDEERRHWLGGEGTRGSSWLRVGGGTAVAVLGVVLLVARGTPLAALPELALAVVAVLAGTALLLAPWALRFWRRLEAEQASRIRETERADIAAHLHDSVLQTLALIQRTDDPARAARLARAQERELRAWLYGGRDATTQSLATAVADIAAEIEELHGVPIDVVVTGDRPHDDCCDALSAALREALQNAVRHGAPPVSAYVEVGRTQIEAYVRDHGAGFDLDEVPADRAGVRESILGRMARHGGTARIRRLESGTEVELIQPVAAPAAEADTEETR